MDTTCIQNARVITPYRVLQNGAILMRGGKIRAVLDGGVPAGNPGGYRIIDAKGLYAAPGFIDIHLHGAGGYDFMDGTAEAILAVARTCAAHGATAIVPTTSPCPDGVLKKTLDAYEEAIKLNPDGAELIGIHLEGPYLNPVQAGAAIPEYVRGPEERDYMEILNRSDHIRRWSVAPELEGALPLGRMLAGRGILPSIGHSDATCEQVIEAFENGYSLITHLYSAMSGVRRIQAFRHAGVIESAYLIDEMDVEIIADGCHLPASLLKLIYKIKGRDRIALVSDSMRAAGGLPEGEYTQNGTGSGRKILVEDGVAKLPDRSAFAGSIATADRLVRTMTQAAGVPLADVVVMATATPARIMGVADRKGSLTVGKDADIVLFDDHINVFLTIAGGRVIYRKPGGLPP